MAEVDVRSGQVWADTDPRMEGRTIRVDEIDGPHAICTILTNPLDVQGLLDDDTPGTRQYTPRDRRGRKTKIRLDRFDGSNRGYTLAGEPA